MIKNHAVWPYIRLAIIAFGVISALRSGYSGPELPWFCPLVIFLITPPMLLTSVQMNERRFHKPWEPPRWDANPFTLDQPFQFYHLASWNAIAYGTISLASLPWMGPDSLNWSLAQFLFGAGGLLGILWSMHIYRDRLVDRNFSLHDALFGLWPSTSDQP